MKKYLILLILPFLTGCAYVNDMRLYSIQPLLPEEKTQQISKVIEAKLVQRGLTLKTRYHDTYPEDVAVTILQIPRLPEEKRREPTLTILIKDGKYIQMKHSEYWLKAFSEKHRPKDVINEVSPDLVSAVKSELGLEIEIILKDKELY